MLLTNAVNTEGRPLEIYVKDGKIAAVGQDLSALAAENETVVDAGGLTVLPAFVDLHCHWRTPGFEYKEDIETGSRAAAAGGYTFVNLMPNTKPVCSSAAQAMMVEQKAAEVGLCDANQTVSITENFDGVSIDHLKTLPASVKFITEDGHGVQDNATMARAFAICTQKDITVMSHAEDMEISPWDYRLAEDIETVRNCWLSEYYQTKLHMCHVSTRGALDAIQMAKLRGAPVTCEVTPHHLWFTNDTCDYRVNPPIRTADDVQALIDAIKRVSLVAERNAPIRMVFSGQELTLSAGTADEAQAKEILDIDMDGEDITAKLTEAPGNHAKIGGLKVTTKDNWFAARPSGTENIYKVYAESFESPQALDKVLAEATEVVDKALAE